MGNKTALYDKHVEANGKIVDFGGWDMPINYGSQIEEHNAVRQDVGMFDVSHMTIVDVLGDDAEAYLQKLLANDVAKLKTVGKALYSGMLKEDGTVIGTRELLHPHVEEQPFTRSLSVSDLPDEPLFIRARDNVGGWSEDVFAVER